MWWVCGCRSKRVPGTDNLLTSPEMFLRVSSIAFKSWNVLCLSDAFSKEVTIPKRSPHSEFSLTLVASRREDASFDLTANSKLGVIILSMASLAVEIEFWIIFSTVSTSLLSCPWILSLKQLCKIWIIIAFTLVVEKLQLLSTVNPQSTVPSLTTFCCPRFTASPIRNILIKVNNLAREPSFWLYFFQSWNHICFNKWIVLITILNKWGTKVWNRRLPNNFIIEVWEFSILSTVLSNRLLEAFLPVWRQPQIMFGSSFQSLIFCLAAN